MASNLAYSLARSGSKVLVIDFDVQNALRLHFGVPIADTRGFVAGSGNESDWSQFILKAGSNTFVFPYGEVTEDQRLEFEHQLATDPHSPASVRATVPVKNIEAWYAAFGVKPGDEQYIAPAARAVIW